jgi:hypothetical protein
MKQGLKYAAGAIALYLAVSYASGSEGILSSGSSGVAKVVAAFQGRAA